MKFKKLFLIPILILIMLLAVGCTMVQSPDGTPFITGTPATETPTETPQIIPDSLPLATPVADSPAAGICPETEGEIVTVTIYPDIPDPRCRIAAPDQMLEVVNARDVTLFVTLGDLEAQIAPGESYLFERIFRDYLAPGVHRIEVSPCCGAELWLQGE